jgi:hypothetical protein
MDGVVSNHQRQARADGPSVLERLVAAGGRRPAEGEACRWLLHERVSSVLQARSDSGRRFGLVRLSWLAMRPFRMLPSLRDTAFVLMEKGA